MKSSAAKAQATTSSSLEKSISQANQKPKTRLWDPSLLSSFDILTQSLYFKLQNLISARTGKKLSKLVRGNHLPEIQGGQLQPQTLVYSSNKHMIAQWFIICSGLQLILQFQQSAPMFPHGQQNSGFLQNCIVPFNSYIVVIDIQQLQQLRVQFQIMVIREELITKKVQILRNQVGNLQQSIFETIAKFMSHNFQGYMRKIRRLWDQKAQFKKDHHCSAQGCGRRYSSKIALRAHIKQKHYQNSSQSDEFQP